MSNEVNTVVMPIDDDIAAETELPSTPPLALDDDDCLKVTKKRERELSLEPSISKEITLSTSAEQKDPRVPAKKNRLEPMAPVEDEEPPPSTPPHNQHQPSSLQSPQHESKVTLIRKRVEDMTWLDQGDRSGPSTGVSIDSSLPSNHSESFVNPPDDREADSAVNGAHREPSSRLADKDTVGGKHDDCDSDSNDGDSENKPMDPDGDDEGDRSLKRKLQDRSSSYNAISDQQTRQDSSKRPRDDTHAEPNPRGIKLAPIPPLKNEQVNEAIPNKSSGRTSMTSGFLAFASSSSPFAKAKPGLNSWSSPTDSPLTLKQSIAVDGDTPSHTLDVKKSINTEQKEASFMSDAESPTASSSETKPKPIFGVTSAPGQGFTGFANLSSPFASTFVSQANVPSTSTSHAGPNRSKSPTRHGSAFTPYNSAARGFATPKSPRRKRSSSPTGSSGSAERTGPEEGSASLPDSENEDRPTSFSDRLKEERGSQADSNQVNKVDLQEQETITGEEDEKTVFSVRAKLFILNEQKQWKEKGIGPLKLNVRKSDGAGPRLIMRKEGVHSLVLNVLLFTGMKFEVAQDPRYVRFGVPNEQRKFDQYNLRLSNAKAVEDLLEAVSVNI